MPKDDSRDPWMNQSREPMPAWERALRPSRSSSWTLLPVAAAVTTLAVFVVFNSWRDWRSTQSQRAQPVAPSSLPQSNVSRPLRNEGRELERPSTPGVQQFAKCISPNGTATYSDGPCPTGTRAGSVSVTPDANLADGMSRDEREASMRQNSALAAAVIQHQRRVAQNVDNSVAECGQLNAQIAAIDAATRQPLSGFEQDRLKDLRRRARDRQFALACG